MVGERLAKSAVLIAKPYPERGRWATPVTLIKFKIPAPVFRFLSERIKRFVNYKCTRRHRSVLAYGKPREKKRGGTTVSGFPPLVSSIKHAYSAHPMSSLPLSLAILRQQEPMTHRVLKRCRIYNMTHVIRCPLYRPCPYRQRRRYYQVKREAY